MKKNTDDTYIDIPETYSRRKLNAMYRDIPLKDTTSRLLRKYFNAMANLYGVIPLRKAWEIVSDQNTDLVSKEEFFTFAEIARHECEDYCIMKDDELYLDGKPTGRLDWKIIDISLLYDEDDALHEVEVCQQGKDYFIPPKAELLRYNDSAYCESTPQSNRMWIFLSKTLRLDERKAGIAFEDILLYTRCLNGGLQKAVDIVERAGAVFNDKTLSEFASIHQNFNNNTRMQHNRGYTPNEINAMSKPEDRIPKSFSFGPNIRKSLADGTMDARELRQSILTMELPDKRLRPLMLQALEEAESAVKIPKVGRNDPCPCGSGKKYKKCCGR